jgi:FMN phosphatase YigB (HAD superfamily)
LKVIAFDLFGTVFDLSGVDRREIVAYIDHISKPEWSLLELPKSWENLKPFWDAKGGIERLRKNFTVVTCSNAPMGFTTRLLKNSGLHFDTITPLECVPCYKPDPRAYQLVAVSQGVMFNDVLMVTGNDRLGRNEHGDREYAAKAGLRSQLIRHEGCPQTIIELAEQLGC